MDKDINERAFELAREINLKCHSSLERPWFSCTDCGNLIALALIAERNRALDEAAYALDHGQSWGDSGIASMMTIDSAALVIRALKTP